MSNQIYDVNEPDPNAPSPGSADAAFQLVTDARKWRQHAQALADVRTLDEWAKANRRFAPAPDWDGKTWGVHVPTPGDVHASERLEGATPDAARAAAAAWVREQVK